MQGYLPDPINKLPYKYLQMARSGILQSVDLALFAIVLSIGMARTDGRTDLMTGIAG